MIDADFVRAVVGNSKPVIVEVGGKQFSSAALHNPPLATEPPYPTLKLYSLDSLIDFIRGRANKDASFVNCFAAAVEFVSAPQGENRKRDVFVRVDADVQEFQFGTYLSLEDFRVQLLTRFAETVLRAQLLGFISKITDSNVLTSEDDGVSQRITAKIGVASYGSEAVPSPVRLNPIRTFAEIEQPEGQFIFRLQSVKDQLPKAALFELHTNWKRAAAMAVKANLDSKKCPVPVFA